MKNVDLFEKISNAVKTGKLSQPFTVGSIDIALDGLLSKSHSFLSKHAEGNPGNYTELFVRAFRGSYFIKADIN